MVKEVKTAVHIGKKIHTGRCPYNYRNNKPGYLSSTRFTRASVDAKKTTSWEVVFEEAHVK